MFLAAMGNLMGKKDGDLGFVLQSGEHPCGEVKTTVRKGEGVRRGVFDHSYPKRRPLTDLWRPKGSGKLGKVVFKVLIVID
jgi:hypothetical protein